MFQEADVSAASTSSASAHACRPGCGACCIAPSISSPIPGMPDGKPAGVRCAQLGEDLQCKIFGSPLRPACCSGLQPQAEMCGTSREEALFWLDQLEAATQPPSTPRGAH
ncbi:YkgJ family cysteine cluster protein [Burkholderia sp. Ax-1719]|nr:YkgJ family cysteine cluster protein [Burkholderia sp. Ax-1719]